MIKISQPLPAHVAIASLSNIFAHNRLTPQGICDTILIFPRGLNGPRPRDFNNTMDVFVLIVCFSSVSLIIC